MRYSVFCFFNVSLTNEFEYFVWCNHLFVLFCFLYVWICLMNFDLILTFPFFSCLLSLILCYFWFWFWFWFFTEVYLFQVLFLCFCFLFFCFWFLFKWTLVYSSFCRLFYVWNQLLGFVFIFFVHFFFLPFLFCQLLLLFL